MGHTACTEPQCLYKGAFYLYLFIHVNSPKYCGRNSTWIHKLMVSVGNKEELSQKYKELFVRIYNTRDKTD